MNNRACFKSRAKPDKLSDLTKHWYAEDYVKEKMDLDGDGKTSLLEISASIMRNAYIICRKHYTEVR